MITPIPAIPSDATAQGPQPVSGQSQGNSLYPSLTAIALTVVLAIASGIVGAFTVLHFQADASESRFAVIDMQQISQAVTYTFGQDPPALRDFNLRFETALRDLQNNNPGRVMLIKEAVLTGHVDDATPTLLALLRLRAPRASLSERSNTLPSTP